MTRSSMRLFVLTTLAVPISGCGDGGDTVSTRVEEVLCSEPIPATDGEAVSLDSALPVCGERGAGLVIQFGGGGLVSPGEVLLSRELGNVYVVVDPSNRPVRSSRRVYG